MPLDLFQQDQNEAMTYAASHSAPDLPATFTDTFGKAFMQSVLFSQSTAALNARTAAAADYAAELEQRTGDRSLQAALSSGGIDRLNRRIGQIAAEHPEFGVKPLDEDTLTERQAARSRQAVADFRAVQAREKTLGGTLGVVAGELAGGVTEPVNVVTFPLAAPASLGVLATAGVWAGIGAGTQAGIELLGAPYRERVQPGYMESGAPLANVAGAALAAGGIGGAFKGAAAAWSRVRTGTWSRAVRDAGNAVDSEANIAATNGLAGAEGEVSHREALGKAIDDLAAGQPVDVSGIVTPEMWAASQDVIARMEAQHHFALPVVDEAAIRAAAEEAGLRARGAELETKLDTLPPINMDAALRLARVQAIEDQMATATGAARKALAQRRDELLTNTTPEQLQAETTNIEQRRALFAERASIQSRLDEIASERARNGISDAINPPAMLGQRSPVNLQEARAGLQEPASAFNEALATETAPEKIAALSDDAEAEAAMLRNLDRLRTERPDFEVPMGETVGEDGTPAPVMRKVDDVLGEADARLSAAKEIMDCVGAYPEAAE